VGEDEVLSQEQAWRSHFT